MIDYREQVVADLIEGINFAEQRGYGGLAETMKAALYLLETQNLKTPVQDPKPRWAMGNEYHDWVCPNCGGLLAPEPAVDQIPGRCPICGQLLKR